MNARVTGMGSRRRCESGMLRKSQFERRSELGSMGGEELVAMESLGVHRAVVGVDVSRYMDM